MSSTQTLDIVKISESSTVQDLQEQHVINSKQSEQIKKFTLTRHQHQYKIQKKDKKLYTFLKCTNFNMK